MGFCLRTKGIYLLIKVQLSPCLLAKMIPLSKLATCAGSQGRSYWIGKTTLVSLSCETE